MQFPIHSPFINLTTHCKLLSFTCQPPIYTIPHPHLHDLHGSPSSLPCIPCIRGCLGHPFGARVRSASSTSSRLVVQIFASLRLCVKLHTSNFKVESRLFFTAASPRRLGSTCCSRLRAEGFTPSPGLVAFGDGLVVKPYPSALSLSLHCFSKRSIINFFAARSGGSALRLGPSRSDKSGAEANADRPSRKAQVAHSRLRVAQVNHIHLSSRLTTKYTKYTKRFSSALAFARRGSLESRTPDKRRLFAEFLFGFSRVEHVETCRVLYWILDRVHHSYTANLIQKGLFYHFDDDFGNSILNPSTPVS